MPRSTLREPSHDARSSSYLANEPNGSGKAASNASFVELLLPKNTPLMPLMTSSPMEEDTPSANEVTSSVPVVGPGAEAAPLRLDMNHDPSVAAEASEVFQSEKPQAGESTETKPIYPPPVSPTQRYQPPVPSLSMKHVTKSPTSANAPTSKFIPRTWHPEPEYTSSPISPVTDSSGKVNRSDSIASSNASSAYSANSATIQIPQPGTNVYNKKISHKRQQSDPKYVRFMSAVSENQKQTEPERYVGYPGLVSYMTEAQSLIFRRFDEVHVRLLLYLQDQISQLEIQLRKLDEQNIGEKEMHHITFREDVDGLRVDIMERLRGLIGEYDTMILAFSRMQESKASEKAVGRLKHWLRRYSGGSAGRQSPPKGGAIARDELEWVEKANDLSNLSLSTTASSTVVKQSPLTRLFPGKKR